MPENSPHRAIEAIAAHTATNRNILFPFRSKSRVAHTTQIWTVQHAKGHEKSVGTQAIPQFLQAPTLDLSLQHPRDCYQIVTKFGSKFRVKCCLSVYTGATFISLGERLPRTDSKMPTTQELVSNLMMKYAEFYSRALEMGFESDTSHFIAARMIDEGLNGKAVA